MQLNPSDVSGGPAQPYSYTEAPVRELCAQIATQEVRVVPVKAHTRARKGECFSNVKSLVERPGGRLISGWAIWNWPGFYARAEHHAIWERPDGQWVDPTPKGQKSILFAADPKATLEGAAQVLRLSKWQPDPRVRGTDRIVDLEMENEQAWFDLAIQDLPDCDPDFFRLRKQMDAKRASLDAEINAAINITFAWLSQRDFFAPRLISRVLFVSLRILLPDWFPQRGRQLSSEQSFDGPLRNVLNWSLNAAAETQLRTLTAWFSSRRNGRSFIRYLRRHQQAE